MFKKGDKIRCIREQWGNETEGKIYIVREDQENGWVKVEEDDKGCPNSYTSDCFELVFTNKSKLEELIEKANEGYSAQFLLGQKYAKECEFSSGYKMQYWEPFIGSYAEGQNYAHQIRAKEKPKFEPFLIKDQKNNQYEVKLDGKNLHVGCQKFDALAVRNVLTLMINNNWVEHNIGSSHFRASKSGITYGQEIVLWEEADKVLTALEKAGV